LSEPIKILLVDDDPDDVFVIERALSDSPLQVAITHAGNGRDGLNRLNAEPDGFDLVLLDINMPVMDGLTMLGQVRADDRFSELPIVVLTTSREKDVLDEALRLGANAAASKASSFEAMRDIVQSIVDLWSGTLWRASPNS
jgi:CheY-like chemotaxis protein